MGLFKKIKSIINVYLFSRKISHKMNGIVLVKTFDSLHNFFITMTGEIQEYCKEKGYDIERICFISTYETNKLKEFNNIIAGSKSDIIIEEYDKKTVFLVVDNWINKGFEKRKEK